MDEAKRMALLGSKSGPLVIMRYLSVASLAGIVVAATLLMLAYRHIAVTRFVDLSQHDALRLTYSLFNSVRHELRRYLSAETHHTLPPSDLLRSAIDGLRLNDYVDDVKVIDDEGVVVFATRGDEAGRGRITDPNVLGALKGKASSEITSGHGLWFGAHEIGAHRLRVYIPFRSMHDGRVLGVFVIAHDVTASMAKIERAQLEVLFTSAFIMLLLYLFVLAISHHAQTIALRHEAELLERSERLAMLSQQLLLTQENDKKRLSCELHEGIAQTLCAIKLRMELFCGGGMAITFHTSR